MSVLKRYVTSLCVPSHKMLLKLRMPVLLKVGMPVLHKLGMHVLLK